ncbi:MAG: hypothetical protein ACE5GW_13540 [Planctomycetota bacterium]
MGAPGPRRTGGAPLSPLSVAGGAPFSSNAGQEFAWPGPCRGAARPVTGEIENQASYRRATQEIRFLPTDFERFRPELQRDRTHNAARLEVRRKLDALGKALAKSLSGPDLALTSRASLHHPYRFNRFRVESQWVYLSRAEKERRELKRILGVELGRDLDQNYVHAILVLEIHQHGLGTAIRIHKDAWWDGENLKRSLSAADRREAFARLLGALPCHGLHIHDHRRIRPCAEITPEEIAETLRYYTPGEHWLHISREIPRDDPFVTDEGLPARLEEEFRSLLPVYRSMRWSPENNFLFEG